jgi:hypothetical protein
MSRYCTILLAGLLLGLAPALPAEARSPVPAAAVQEPEELRRFEAALPKLGLYPEQKPRIAALLKDVRASLRQIQASGATPDQKQQKQKALHKSAQTRLNQILTVAQAEKLKTLMHGPRATAKKPHGR